MNSGCVAARARVAMGGYLVVLRAPQVGRLATAMVIGRLPNGMLPIGVVVLINERLRSYEASGAVLAALMVGTTVSAPFRGRAVDRWGQSRILIPLVSTQAAALAGLVLAAFAGANVVLVLALAALVGATGSTLGGSMRALWPALVVVASPPAVLGVAGIAAVVGTATFATTAASRSVNGRPRGTGPRGAGLRVPGMRVLTTTLLFAGVVTGMLNVAVPAYAERQGESWAGGVLLAVIASSSMIGGLWYGAVGWTATPGRRYVRLAIAAAVAVSLLAVAGSAAILGGLLALVGIFAAPRMITAYTLLDELAPRDSLTQGYSWLVSGIAAGSAVGSTIAGAVVQRYGVPQSFALAGVSAAVGAGVAVMGRAALGPSATNVVAKGCVDAAR
ncbi:hypothetical protein ACIA49_35300 [Kribbella sp. NPDC051587]|uniref:hypothetical protein n=1 Tax=Kribbella sp. NPDC051587 TaxID=3364119 RepID=UPI0037A08447